MSNDEKVARRYAKALFELCAPRTSGGRELESTRIALHSFAESWQAHADFRNAILNPAISLSQRMEAVKEKANLIAPGDSTFGNFLLVILENNRLGMIGAVSREFSSLVEAFRRIMAIEVTSAIELSEQEKDQIQSDIQKRIPSQYASLVSVTWRIEPEILGGLRMKVGDRLLDSSIRGSLDRIERDLNAIGHVANAAVN